MSAASHSDQAITDSTKAAAIAAEATANAVAEMAGEDKEPIMPVAGLGVDIIEIDRMEQAIKRTPRMVTRMFSAAEQTYAKKKARPAVQYALFFAAKEAVLKALGCGFAGMDAFTDVEVSHDRYGKPVPVLSGKTKELAREQGIIDMQLSLSYTRSVGVASAVAIKEQNRPRRAEKIDQKAELAKKFKELRALLDEMDPTGEAGETSGDKGGGGTLSSVNHPLPPNTGAKEEVVDE